MRIPILAVVISGAALSACMQSSTPLQPQEIIVPVSVQSEPAIGVPRTLSESAQAAGNRANHRTHLTGAEEVPPRDTAAQGQAIFQVNPAGTAISYRLNVANIENVTQAHIHLAPAGSNGGIVAWLYPASSPAQLIPGRTQGTLREGVLTAASLVNALAGQPLSALITAIENGGAYVNVHTQQLPGGEIRGQID